MGRISGRNFLVGLVVLGGVGGIAALAVLAGVGPGFLVSRQAIEVDFRNAQGLRTGCPVRVAGLDAGRVASVGLVENDGLLVARARIILPKDLVRRLREDVRITVQAGITGQSMLNVVSTGRSETPLDPSRAVKGVETTMFDPIMEQIGLGPLERNHLSETIAEVRKTAEAAGPRLRQILGSLEQTAEDFRETASAVRPVVESTAQRIDTTLPKVEVTLGRLDSLLNHTDLIVGENRQTLAATLKNVEGLTAEARDIAQQDRKKVEELLEGLGQTRQRVDRVLYNSDIITAQGARIVTQHQADLERTVTNVRDTTSWADKLVQKLYSNPFYLSPLYKPKEEDIRAQAAFDAAQNFSMGAKEFHDALKTLQALQSKPLAPADRQKVDQLLQQAGVLTQQLNQSQQQIAEGLRPLGGPRSRVERK